MAYPSLRFEPSRDGMVPRGAYQCGHGNEGPEYVGRAHHEGYLIAGRIVPTHRVCYIGFKGAEIGVREYEVLVCDRDAVKFVPYNRRELPTGVVIAGYNLQRENLLVGRVKHEGINCCGHVNDKRMVLYFPYGGKEHTRDEYELLCVTKIRI